MYRNRVLTVVILIFAIHSTIPAQTQLDYADHLFKDKDFFRAISAYKEALYYTGKRSLEQYCLAQIALSYYNSHRYKASITFLSRLLNHPNIEENYHYKALIFLGLNYYQMKLHSKARSYWRQAAAIDSNGLAACYLGLLILESGNWRRASQDFSEIALTHPQTLVGQIASDVSQDALQAGNLPRRNPHLAATMSAFLPGSGQIYSKHYYDGLQALGFVTAFAFSSYAMYKFNRSEKNSHLTTYFAISIAGLFHLGNIYGAQRTAEYFNRREKNRFLDAVRSKILRIQIR